jgi:hypothetical protein
MQAQLVQIRLAAALQRLGRGERKNVYERALERRAVTLGGATLYGTEAVRWMIGERMVELASFARRSVAAWDIYQQEAAAPYLLILDALASPRPSQSLTSLVRQAATQAAESRRVQGQASGQTTVPERAGFLAIEELRRLDAGAETETLKSIIELLREAKNGDRQPKANIGQNPSNDRDRKLESLGSLGISIAGVIGDLGNREFEREALGGRTQLDQVSEAEKKLVGQGKLQTREMVSR